jgi:FkbM family methyltransferase
MRTDTIEVEADGLKWLVDMDSHNGDRLGPLHEDTIQATVLDLIPEGGTLLDVGAHVGHYTLRAVMKGAWVIAIEPNPETASRLHQNLALNNLADYVRVIEVAAWDERGHGAFLSPSAQVRDGSMRVVPHDNGKVRMWPLDALLGSVHRIDAVKLDVEGSDLHALRGMRKTLERLRPTLFVEDHSIFGYYERNDLLKLLAELHYVPEPAGEYCGANYYLCRHSSVLPA